MRILGISAFYHDSAAALVVAGRIVAAVQEERFTRIKQDAGFPRHAIDYCLAAGGVGLDQVDYVVFYEKPFLKFERLLETYVGFAPRGLKSFATAVPIWIREKLFQKDMLAREDTPDARLAEMELDTLPDDTAGAVRALADYQWHSPEAKALYDSITQMLRTEALDAQFTGMKQALSNPDSEAMRAVKDMLADLNALLAAHARQEDTTDQFAEFMAKHGEFFPEQPKNVDELIDALLNVAH